VKHSLLILLAIAPALITATTVRPVSIETMAGQASLIAEGHAVSSWSQWNPQHTIIITYTRFRVSRALKGAAGGEVTIRQPGGSVGVYKDVVHGLRYLKSGEEAVVFLQESDDHDGSMVIVGLMQGMFRMSRDNSGEAYVSNGVSGVQVQGDSGAVTDFRGSRVPLSEFEARVTKVAK